LFVVAKNSEKQQKTPKKAQKLFKNLKKFINIWGYKFSP